MANSNGWGDGAANNAIGWGQGANNAIGWGDSHAKSWAGLTDIVGTQTAALLLDTYSGAAVGYSLRKLRSAYSGNAIRVRRSSDNAEQDFGFVDNVLDTASLIDFVGYNMWNYSEDISQSVYSVSATSRSLNIETAPDGTLTGDKVIEDTSFAEHGLNRPSDTILNSTPYTTSAYFKQGGRTKIRIYINISGANQQCDLDLTNGTTSNNTFANTPIVTAEANGWYRFSVTITSGSTSATNGMTFRLFNASNSLTYTGNGTSGIFAWGYQLSQTSSVKTYQRTVATAGGNGFITTWYDQSSNANNSVQSTAVNQPQIVLSGAMINVNSKPSIRFNSKFMTNSITGSLPANLSVFTVRNMATYPNTFRTLFNYKTYGLTYNSAGGVPYGTAHIFGASTSQAFSNYPTTNGQAIDFMYNKLNLERNNFAATLGSADIYAAGTASIGSWSGTSQMFDGEIQELIIYELNQNTNKVAIKSNINTFYTIY